MKTLIQIGTCNGGDDFQRICESQNEKCLIILVEPNHKLNDKIKANYSNLWNEHEIHIVNKAIVNDEKIKMVDLYLNDGQGLEVMSSLIQRRTYNLTTSASVEAITINELLNQFAISKIDELHIDAEGMDYNIMLSLDIDKFDVRVLSCEIWPYDNDDLNSRFETGPTLLKKVIGKFKDYSVSNVILGGMPSLLFVKSH